MFVSKLGIFLISLPRDLSQASLHLSTPSLLCLSKLCISYSDFVFGSLHVVGLIFAMFINITRLAYARNRFMDAFMTISFYILSMCILAISLYLVFFFGSGDMLLICATAGIILYRRFFPRFWSLSARRYHWDYPMWRVKNNLMHKRVRTRSSETRNKKSLYSWNGDVYEFRLMDGTIGRVAVEEIPRHWEKHQLKWRRWIVDGRIGVRSARRGAMALRMAFMLPLPAKVWIRLGERYAAKGSVGAEVREIWGMGVADIPGICGEQWRSKRDEWLEMEEREELAMVLHLKLLMYEESKRVKRDESSGSEDRCKRVNKVRWMEMVDEWFEGEMKTGSVEFRTYEEHLLAQGVLDGGERRFWYFYSGSYEEVRKYREWKRERKLVRRRRDREQVEWWCQEENLYGANMV